MRPLACSEEVGALILETALLIAKHAYRQGKIPSREVDEARGVAVVRMVASIGSYDPARGELKTYLSLIAWCGVRDHVRWLRGRGKSIRPRVEGCGLESESRRRCCNFCPFEDSGCQRDRETGAALNRVDEVLNAAPPRIAAACHQWLAEYRGGSDVPPISRSMKSRIRGACATLFLTRAEDSSPPETDAQLQSYSP